MSDMVDKLEAAGVNPATVRGRLTNKSALALLKLLFKNGWQAVPVPGPATTLQMFEFVNETGMYSPHVLYLDDRGLWWIDASVGM